MKMNKNVAKVANWNKNENKKRNSPRTKAPARERGIAWGACDKAASFGIANSFIVAPGPKKRNL